MPNLLKLSDPVLFVDGVTKKISGCLDRLGIKTVGDLVSTVPRDYRMLPAPVKCGQIREGTMALIGTVTEYAHSGNNNTQHMKIQDNTGTVHITWFHRPYINKYIVMGKAYVFLGKCSPYNGYMSMSQPDIIPYEEYAPCSGAYYPVYNLTKGITNKILLELIMKAQNNLSEYPPDIFPKEMAKRLHLMSKWDSLRCVQYPANETIKDQAARRIKFDDFFELLLEVKRSYLNRRENTKVFQNISYTYKLSSVLPYPLTGSQKQAIQTILNDFRSKSTANRLIQGDVGCGKTIVAFMAMMAAYGSGFQSVIMVPTEVLAQQHYSELVSYCEKIGIDKSKAALLVGSMTAKQKDEVKNRISSGNAMLIVGTHAVIQPDVQYKNLGLSIVDEQHRFGVEQRKILSEKGEDGVHSITMTATPIPRTTASILFGGMDISYMKDRPSMRLPIISKSLSSDARRAAFEAMLKEIENGHQAYIICPLVSEDDKYGKKSVEEYGGTFSRIFPGTPFGLLHGKMAPKTKNEAMQDFAEGKTKVLISTTVVEVGVNVPNATVIIIEAADSFGILQLHQLRGRVGRGKDQSYCFFISSNAEINEKLQIIEQKSDGFEVAESDYKLRRAGHLFGTKQSGDMGFKLADIVQDENILIEAESCVEEYLQNNPPSCC